MTNELNNRINAAENFSTDLVHEIRNPLASLKSASEIISETTDKVQREKLVCTAPHTLPVRRLDDVKAARELDLSWSAPS